MTCTCKDEKKQLQVKVKKDHGSACSIDIRQPANGAKELRLP